MEEWIEIEGESKEDAVERACAALNTTRSHLKYEVVEDGNALKIRARRVEEPIEGADPTEIGKKAREFLSKLLEFFDPEVKVEMEDLEDEIRLDIQGNGTGLLIGKHGSTLEALQHLVHKAVRLDQREGKRLVVDSERYRERRREALEGLARKLAGRARREGRPVSVEPMNAMDRRILHMALADHPDVTTKSVGEGRNRKVIVIPRGGTRLDSRRGGRSGPMRGRGGRQGP
ncbi:MAG TPA: RNA-binding cell elongation regulator Jag/EloR, partial [Bdellovibrionota bacterium]|nr:RNA-binding cell elongation regulator Jag/EloR [Bdellovibrionota bacterium]